METINPLQFAITYSRKPQGLLRSFLRVYHPLANRANAPTGQSQIALQLSHFSLGLPSSVVLVFVLFCFCFGFLFIPSLAWLLVFVKTFVAQILAEKFFSHDRCPPWESCPSKFVNLCYPLSDFSPTLSLSSLRYSPHFPAVCGRIVSSVKQT